MKYLILCLFLCSCDVPTQPLTIAKTFQMDCIGITSRKVNDSTYYMSIDTTQWQTFERVFVNTSESAPVLIKWEAISKRYGYYYKEPYYAPTALINYSSYTDKTQQANTILSIYRRMVNDTVMVMAAYNDGEKTYFDSKYFIIFVKN